MKIQYEINDEVIMTRSIVSFLEGQIVKVVDTDYNTMYPYLVEDDNTSAWVGEDDIEPATVSLLTEMNEAEVTEYKDKMLEADNKKCLEFLANNSSEYFSPEEIYKKAGISFTSLKTLERTLVHQSELPWKSEKLGYEVTYKLKLNKKKYYGDDGSVLFRGKSEHYFCAVKKVKEEYDYDDEEECEEDE